MIAALIFVGWWLVAIEPHPCDKPITPATSECSAWAQANGGRR